MHRKDQVGKRLMFSTQCQAMLSAHLILTVLLGRHCGPHSTDVSWSEAGPSQVPSLVGNRSGPLGGGELSCYHWSVSPKACWGCLPVSHPPFQGSLHSVHL